MKMVYDQASGVFLPQIVDSQRLSGSGCEFDVCPGRGLAINEMARQLYSSTDHNSFELGLYRIGVAAHTANPQILKNASSGGVMTEIARYLIESKLVEGATASRFVYGPSGPKTESFIARSLDELLSAQGSKYCPTTTNQLVRECVQAGKRYFFIGTPCQVGALRLAMKKDPSLVEIFPYTMSNFCGGYRDFRCLNEIISSYGIRPANVKFFRFRGGGQPGSMLVETDQGRDFSAPYPDYGERSTIPKLRRCWYCIDATGELADFACGDAWIPRLMEDEYPWSIILGRSAFAEKTIREMAEAGLLTLTAISSEEICASQKSNLNSKKLRQYKRMRISRLLGIAVPSWDVELPRAGGNYFHEILILFGKTSIGQKLRVINITAPEWLKNSNIFSR